MPTQHDPKGLGKVLVANAGTPVPIKGSAFMVKSCTILPDPANAGTYMYVKDINGNILAKLAKTITVPYVVPIVGVFDLSQLQLDTDTNNDGAYVAYV
jgi:hypothetical protein